METVRSTQPNANGALTAGNSPAPARVAALPPVRRVSPTNAAAAAQDSTPAPLGRGLAAWDDQLQGDVTRAQQALDYLNRLQGQLENIKSDLAARLSGARTAGQLDARISQLGGLLDARRNQGGNGVDAQLGFTGDAPAQQRFRIRGLDIGTLKAAGARTLSFTVAGGPQVNVTLDGDLSADEIAQRFDRALAPLNLHAGLDNQGQLVFSAAEADWAGVSDSIVLVGAGRVTTEAIGDALSPQGWQTGNPDALRQSLREVVQALARVRRSQEAASAALSAAIERAAAAKAPPPEEAQQLAQNFASTASSPDYDSLIALTSALVGVSLERVQALLGLR
jgi:hypothetical protein